MDQYEIRYWNKFCSGLFGMTKFLTKCYRNVIFLEIFKKILMKNCLKFCGLVPTYRCVTLTLHPKCGHSAILYLVSVLYTLNNDLKISQKGQCLRNFPTKYTKNWILGFYVIIEQYRTQDLFLA